MNAVQTCLLIIFIALLTSSWWAVAMFGGTAGSFPIFLFTFIFTAIAVVLLGALVVRHYDDPPMKG